MVHKGTHIFIISRQELSTTGVGTVRSSDFDIHCLLGGRHLIATYQKNFSVFLGTDVVIS